MRHLHTNVALLAAAGMLGAAALAQGAPAAEPTNGTQHNQTSQQQSQTASNEKGSANKQSTKAPEGFVIVDEQLITLTANEPQNHFLRAKEYLAANDSRAAAAEVRIAAGYLDMQASRKGEADQKGLRSESHDLRQLADQIAAGQANGKEAATTKQPGEKANGESAEQKRLNESFATAERVLAQHFQEEAKNELNKQKDIRAGEDLDAAASALNASIVWSGEQCSKECTQAITNARRVSDELLSPGEKANNAASQQQPNNGKAETADSEAQPASARLTGEAEQGSAQASAKAPADAEKTVDELGKAIESGAGAAGQQNQNQGNQPHASAAGNK